jgi:hypothetical protein
MIYLPVGMDATGSGVMVRWYIFCMWEWMYDFVGDAGGAASASCEVDEFSKNGYLSWGGSTE